MARTITGLAGIREELAKRPASGGNFEDRPKARWAFIPANGGPLKLVFLQELDEGSPHYSAKNGKGTFSIQHSNPENWHKNAACTSDEDDCYGCSSGWRQKIVLYINVLVDDGKEAPYVGIWSRGLGKGSVAQDLLNMAGDDDFDNSISDKTFKFTRSGTTKDDTTYSLSPMPKAHAFNIEDYELYNLEDYIFTVAPERQEAYYLDGQVEETPVPAGVASGRGRITTDSEW